MLIFATGGGRGHRHGVARRPRPGAGRSRPTPCAPCSTRWACPPSGPRRRRCSRDWRESLPPLLTLPCGPDGCAVPGSMPGDRFRLDLETGERIEGKLEMGWAGEARLPALNSPGYHRLTLDAGHATVAAAPPRCFSLEDAGADPHGGAAPWALAAQIYSIHTPGDCGIGDFAGVAALARDAARRGAAALAISPAHALFAADPGKYRALCAVEPARAERAARGAGPGAGLAAPAAIRRSRSRGTALIDWPGATRRKLARLRALFDGRVRTPRLRRLPQRRRPPRSRTTRGSRRCTRAWSREDPPRWNWREWPQELRTPDSPGAARFFRENAGEVAFHAFCQWLADASLGAAQRAAREAGHADRPDRGSGGRHRWRRQPCLVAAGGDPFRPLRRRAARRLLAARPGLGADGLLAAGDARRRLRRRSANC